MNFEAVLHYKHQNQARDEKKKLRHASGANITNATTAATTAASAAAATSTEGSNSESEAESNENSPTPSPLQKKVTEVTPLTQNRPGHGSAQKMAVKLWAFSETGYTGWTHCLAVLIVCQKLCSLGAGVCAPSD